MKLAAPIAWLLTLSDVQATTFLDFPLDVQYCGRTGYQRLDRWIRIGQALCFLITKFLAMKRISLLGLLITVFLSACATQLDTGAEKVRIVTATQKESCESLGIVSTDQQLGLNKASNAMNKAINEVARRGGDAIFMVSTGTSGLDGASVTAEALRCKSV